MFPQVQAEGPEAGRATEMLPASADRG